MSEEMKNSPEPILTVRGYELVRLLVSADFEICCNLDRIPFPSNITANPQNAEWCRVYSYKGTPVAVIETFPGTFQLFKATECTT